MEPGIERGLTRGDRGQYLTPGEMEALTKRWAPYRSLGVYYMWAVAEESS